MSGRVIQEYESKAEFLRELSEAVPLMETSHAALNSIPDVAAQARKTALGTSLAPRT